MKQNDIVLIIVCIFVSGVLSLVLSNILIASPENRQAEVEVVERITSDFNLPDERYFNEDSVNPTQVIQIGGENTNQPSFTNQ